MARVAPIYSVGPTDRKVYHNNDYCRERNNIETFNVRQGTDGRPLCEHCAKWNAEGK